MRKSAARSASKRPWPAAPALAGRHLTMCDARPRRPGSACCENRNPHVLRPACSLGLRQEGRSRPALAGRLSPSIPEGGGATRGEELVRGSRIAETSTTTVTTDDVPKFNMSHFHYVNGTLHAEEVPLDRLAAAIGTPFYCYSSAILSERYHAFARAFDG